MRCTRVLFLAILCAMRLGEIVPADVKLIEGDYLLADESALTGESLPVENTFLTLRYSGAIIGRVR